MKEMRFFIVAGMLALLLILSMGPSDASFAGSNGEILFMKDAPQAGDSRARGQDIWTLDPVTRLQEKLPEPINSSAEDGTPAVSADGNLLAFESNRTGDREIYVFDFSAVVNPLKQLTFLPGDDLSPAFSPDGQWLAFRHYPERGSQRANIYKVSVSGGSPVRLTNTPGDDFLPSWSPDGSRIAFSVVPSGERDQEIFTMSPDGSNLTRLTSNMADDQVPDFSPSGSEIVYQRVQRRPSAAEIWKMSSADVDGDGNAENQTPLVTSDWSTDNRSPDYSPDGTKIVFNSSRDGNLDLYVLDLATGLVSQLTLDLTGVDNYSPEWTSR